MKEDDNDASAAFRIVNVEGTRRLAEEAASAGVGRLVYLNSVKLDGEATERGQGFQASDASQPVDFHGQSKYEAEVALAEVAARTGLEVVG